MDKIIDSFQNLKHYCEKDEFRGWDPYDGLNSKIFQALPYFKKSSLFRLILIQGFKQSPINFRRLFFVPKQYNAKGIGLFLSGYCNIYNAQKNSGNNKIGTQDELLEKIKFLADLLIEIQSKGNFHGACWGYSFDWESKAFFLPKYTPTVVVTSFVVEALLSAYDITKNEIYYKTAISSSDFILKDLNRIKKERGFMFSYSPIDNRAVYNATLLGTKTLSLIYKYTKDEKLKELAYITAQAVCDVQNPDGSFPHSDQAGNVWRDNFHTGFKLESLEFFRKYCNVSDFDNYIDKGYEYWINNFFDFDNGIALYYDRIKNKIIDLHCVSQAMVTLYKLDKIDTLNSEGEKLLNWAIDNMQDNNGAFCFQKDKYFTNRIKYMRWPNAWMFYGMSYYILGKTK